MKIVPYCMFVTLLSSQLLPGHVLAETDGKLCDVALGGDSRLLGQMTNESGRGIANGVILLYAGVSNGANVSNAPVVIRTDEAGNFASEPIRGGLYVIEVADEKQALRVWTVGAAPPRAAKSLLLIDESPTVRGQTGGLRAGRLASRASRRSDGSSVVSRTLRFVRDRPVIGGTGIATAIAVPIAVPVGIAIAKDRQIEVQDAS